MRYRGRSLHQRRHLLGIACLSQLLSFEPCQPVYAPSAKRKVRNVQTSAGKLTARLAHGSQRRLGTSTVVGPVAKQQASKASAFSTQSIYAYLRLRYCDTGKRRVLLRLEDEYSLHDHSLSVSSQPISAPRGVSGLAFLLALLSPGRGDFDRTKVLGFRSRSRGKKTHTISVSCTAAFQASLVAVHKVSMPLPSCLDNTCVGTG